MIWVAIAEIGSARFAASIGKASLEARQTTAIV
jgi:hypothetical protein